MLKFRKTPTIPRPGLTLPPAEADLLRAAYEGAGEILEYGSGGSTVMAAEMRGKRVTSVESDADWAQMMRDYLGQHRWRSKVNIIHADIGPTTKWGHPDGPKDWRKYPGYPLKVWDSGIAPDVVLVDGRFRIGCALATAIHTHKPVRVLFDDYINRPRYHRVEEFLGRPQMTGRMAEFTVTPMPVQPDRLLRIIQLMCAVQ